MRIRAIDFLGKIKITLQLVDGTQGPHIHGFVLLSSVLQRCGVSVSSG
jgi:hypothetical protein